LARAMTFMNGIRGRQFVDTNILVYVNDNSAGNKQVRARELVTHLWETNQGCVSIQVLQEFYVTVTHKWKIPLPVTSAIQIVRDLSQ
jgi:predicted nucleic acid-binding protein